MRVKTVAPSGTPSYWFAPTVLEHDGVREHDVTVGDRVLARVLSFAHRGAQAAASTRLAHRRRRPAWRCHRCSGC